MNILRGKKIIVGVSGGIAAYKAPLLIRELLKLGAEVRALLTPSAEQFVSKLVLQNLTKHNVTSQMFDSTVQSGGAWHIELAEWAEAMIIAPCSANTLAKLAMGVCDNPLLTVALALNERAKLLVSPSMDCGMYNHPTMQRNMEIVKMDGAIVIPPDVGELASGLFGSGRLPDIPMLVKALENAFINEKTDNIIADLPLANKNIVITAGPTYEKIDAVRFIGNYSSGKMGFALAKVANELGANVTLISGPVSLETPNKSIVRIDVESASEMYDAAIEANNSADVFIMSAAVADFTPTIKHQGKLKKRELGENLEIALAPTKDILKELGKIKKESQFLVGFALESDNIEKYALDKLEEKNCDMIVANLANKPDSGFKTDNNTITIIDKKKNIERLTPMSKEDCAKAILHKISEELLKRSS